jgi:very-short-patch-repair endonuclease/superfamily I DNA/RNA helicase
MAEVDDSDVLRLTTKLVDFLAEVTDAAVRDPVRDILAGEAGAPELILWLDQLPEGIRVNDQSVDDVLLRVRPPSLSPEPQPPAELVGWIDSPKLHGFDGREPELLELGPIDVEPESERVAPPNSIVRIFTRWIGTWRQWSKEQKRRDLYEKLESAAKTLEQRDDEFEFVLAVGLICWEAPDGEQIRRHLVTEPVLPKLDRETAEVTVSRVSGKRRFEDKEVLGTQEAYQPDRGRIAKAAVIESDASLLGEQTMVGIQGWLALGLGLTFETVETTGAKDELPTTPVLSASSALVLRPRSRVLLAEAYKRIAEALRETEVQVPVGLAQLVVDTEIEQRHRWLSEQGAVSGDVLGSDPLFPLPANDEQMRVIELLRTESSVVVQGPPGTGKTHTIANLVSALLARGQRVLVTSQKDQALKVLRDKIPAELRQLCVLLAGGSKDAAKELEQGLDALSKAVASTDARTVSTRTEVLAAERQGLRSRSAELNNRIRELRDVENVRHEPVVPGFSSDVYRGTLTEIVREVKRAEATYGWIPAVGRHAPDVPPLSNTDMIELHRLLRSDSPARRSRAFQEIPRREVLPSAGELAYIIDAERQARATAHGDTSALTRQLADVGAEALQQLQQLSLEARALLHRLGFAEDGTPSTSRDWVARAVGDRLAGRHAGLWGHLVEVRGEPRRLQQRLQSQGVNYVIGVSPPISSEMLGTARGWLNAGRNLRAYLQAGGKLRTRFPKQAQKDAADLLQAIRVDGRPPETIPQLDVALERLEAEVAAIQLAGKWADAGVEVSAGRLAVTLSELDDNGRLLDDIEALVAVHTTVTGSLAQAEIDVELSSPVEFVRVLSAVPRALRYVELARTRSRVNELHQTVRAWASRPEACPDLALLLTAIANRDLDAYTQGIKAIEVARAEQADELRRAHLEQTLSGVHPALLDLLQSTAHEPVWEQRIAALPAAWAWSKAQQFVARWRNADEERRLGIEFDQVEDRIKHVTEQLAGTEATRACLDRMTDTHARALRSYREHMVHVGAGTGIKTREFRKAARAAMEKAKSAVPAWVVPLPNLLENIAPERNSFDVVIVDEASQVGLEQLFLLWMAPRVIVVGDDRQCTPGANRMGQLDPLFKSLHEHLADIDPEIRLHFTPKSNLYGLLSSRSGKDAVVGLREHFRCMPEIINWSSSQFYGEKGRPGLIPLRERTAQDLEPLKVVEVASAYTEGRDAKRRNPVEAKCIVNRLLKCIEDAKYAGKTFGVVVLQGTGQVKLLDHEINAAISAEQRQERNISVGSPPNFQGDERDVIFLSMVAAEPPQAQYATMARQAYNVAASRAKDQMWLFTSVRRDQLKPGDLRASLLEYMQNPPSVFGRSPALESVSATQPSEPFESLFEQRVFREIKQRGYHVVPQHKVGSRSLDLVVTGDGGRLAVECDGHYWHTSPSQQVSDAHRDRELRRMGWDLVRIRESEFEFDTARELAPLWQRLEERGIHPHTAPADIDDEWTPISLPEVDELDELEGSKGAEL